MLPSQLSWDRLSFGSLKRQWPVLGEGGNKDMSVQNAKITRKKNVNGAEFSFGVQYSCRFVLPTNLLTMFPLTVAHLKTGGGWRGELCLCGLDGASHVLWAKRRGRENCGCDETLKHQVPIDPSISASSRRQRGSALAAAAECTLILPGRSVYLKPSAANCAE